MEEPKGEMQRAPRAADGALKSAPESRQWSVFTPAPCLVLLWCMRSFARKTHMEVYAHRFAAANTLVFRSSELLFHWAEVVAVLRAVLPVRPGADFSEAARLRDVATKEDPRSRGLAEARAFYAEPRNRIAGFSEAELRYMAETLDPALLAGWGYRHPATGTDAGDGASGANPSLANAAGGAPPKRACWCKPPLLGCPPQQQPPGSPCLDLSAAAFDERQRPHASAAPHTSASCAGSPPPPPPPPNHDLSKATCRTQGRAQQLDSSARASSLRQLCVWVWVCV